MNNDYGLKKIQEELLQTLLEFDKICRNHNIKYSLHGGTLLGAVRNKQMIPWDDDVDISITRESYERLLNVCNEKYTHVMIDETYGWVPHFYLKDASSPQILIDILIWDYISEIPAESKIKLLVIEMLQGMLKGNVNYSSYKPIYRPLLLLTSIMGRIYTKEQKLKLLSHVEKNFAIGNKKYIHKSNDSFKGIHEIYPDSFMREYVELDFEGYKFYAMKEHKKWLVDSFGDNYMTPPPISERNPLHTERLKANS